MRKLILYKISCSVYWKIGEIGINFKDIHLNKCDISEISVTLQYCKENIKTRNIMFSAQIKVMRLTSLERMRWMGFAAHTGWIRNDKKIIDWKMKDSM